jgi:uncharacterized membrane protein YedE/YeeE
MDLIWLLDRAGEGPAAVIVGLVTGLVFGVAAQRSRFCLRAATVEFGRGQVGERTTIWFLTFATALFWVQAMQMAGLADLDGARQLASPGSISGAAIGGLMFGVGMVMARGCSGRLLVLAATGNPRALVAGLVFAAVAQASLHGALSPLRESLAGLWITPGGRNVHLAAALGLPQGAGVAAGLGFTALALWAAWRNRVGPRVLFMASGVGFAVALGWLLTFSLSLSSFEPVAPESVSFTGPSADTLMFVMSQGAGLDFDLGLIPGVALGALLAALWAGEARWQGFDGPAAMRRYLTGAGLMGFGGMLAGGCAIGAGVTGGSVLSLTAWTALACMWIGAMAADAALDRHPSVAAA